MNLRLWECGELIQISTSTGGEQYIVIKFVTCFVVSFFGFDRAFRYLLTGKRVVKPLLQLVRRNRFSAYDVSPANAVPVNICLCHIFQTRVLVSEQALERVLGGWGGGDTLSCLKQGVQFLVLSVLNRVPFFLYAKQNKSWSKLSPVLNKVAKWTIFVLNSRVGVWRPRRQSSTQTSLDWVNRAWSGLICG